MKAIRNISFAVLLALVLSSGTIKLGATPEDWCPANCSCLGLNPPSEFVQIDCEGYYYMQCADHAYIDCPAYCESIGAMEWFNLYAYGDCLNTCMCYRVQR